ncbi:MAG: GTP-binding protein [Rhodospirillales bacterium]|nr:GTP-binding protein [Rhodospirillales bacterium]
MTPDNANPAATEVTVGETIPVTVITGFLGSGKTTLLSAILGHSGMDRTAVLINEFGEVALDHILVRKIDENVVLLNSGCLCCTIRGDLIDSMRDLFLKRVRGDIPEFDRLVIETTGLADPAPVIHTMMTDPLITSRYRLDGIVTTVDAKNGSTQLDEYPESVKQAAVADRLIITKSDIASPDELSALEERLKKLNPAAPIISAQHGKIDPKRLFNAGLFDTSRKTPDVEAWLHAESYRTEENHGHDHDHHHDINRHDARIRSFCLTFDKPVRWESFANAINLLIATKGESLLRIKGILYVTGEDRPVAIHGIQHVFHPPVALTGLNEETEVSRIVFITRDLGKNAVEGLLRALLEGDDFASNDH